MRKFTCFTLGLLLACAVTVNAQEQKNDQEGYKFTDIKRLPTTSVKSQDRAGTCWSWSTISFLDSEIMRMGKDSLSLSPMYVVWNTYHAKGDKYVRMNGHVNFGQGGASADVTWAIRNYGIVPLSLYSGLNYGEEVHVHGELDAILKGYLDAVVSNPNKKLSTAWLRGYDGILNAYLGEKPEKFTWQGKEYTPKTFAESLGINPDDYVSLTSFTHHPFYTQMNIEIQDNWRNGLSYNLPLMEFMSVIDNAVNNGYTVAWGSDVSETGFTRDGIAVMPDADRGAELTGSDMARWTGLTAADKRKELTSRPLPEITVTQEMRQTAFDNWETTDDHGMLIYGIAKDQNGKEYYMVKNSWGTNNKYKGTWYASKPFVAYKTINILVHKDAVPKALLKKLGIK